MAAGSGVLRGRCALRAHAQAARAQHSRAKMRASSRACHAQLVDSAELNAPDTATRCRGVVRGAF
jgi:hypothetical protein